MTKEQVINNFIEDIFSTLISRALVDSWQYKVPGLVVMKTENKISYFEYPLKNNEFNYWVSPYFAAEVMNFLPENEFSSWQELSQIIKEVGMKLYPIK